MKTSEGGGSYNCVGESVNRPCLEGVKPFAPESHKIHVLNNFPVPLMFFAARVVGVAPKAAKGELPPDPLMSSVSAGPSCLTHHSSIRSYIGDCLIIECPVHNEGRLSTQLNSFTCSIVRMI